MKRRGIKLSLLGSVSLLGILGLSSCELDLSNLGNVKVTTDDSTNTNNNDNNTGNNTDNNGNTGTGTGTNTGTGTGTGTNTGTGTGTGTGTNTGTGTGTGTNTGTGTGTGTGTNTGTGTGTGTNTGTGTGTGGTSNPNTPTYTEYNGKYNYVEAPSAPTYDTDGGRVDVYVNYSSMSGVSRSQSIGSVLDPITNEQLAPGSVLPTWRAFQSYTRTTIKDATTYEKSTDNYVWTNVTTNNFKSEVDTTQNIDVIYNRTTNFSNNTSMLTPLDDYISQGKMPNFKNYLEKNPSIKKALTIGGHIYYTPYFDGQDDIERMFIMDTALTKKVLDSTSGWDRTTTNGGANPSANVVQGGFYQPFIDANFNYASDTTIKILFNREVKEVTVKKTDNIIKQQNELLAKGCTGQELAQQFIAYINTAYKDIFDKGYYKNPSDLFISSAAAYNTDDLIALMRVVKANPGMISGDANAEITTFFPRAASNNRIDNIYDLTQIWGVQGVDSENGNFYVGGDGKVHALETTQASYDALEYLSQIYDEGLILRDFYTDLNNPRGNGTGFLDKYYKKTLADSSYGFMMYDYIAANAMANDIYDGIGTKSTLRKNGFNDPYECKGITAVLAPLTYWGTNSSWNPNQAINDKTGKTLNRYYEANRGLKGNSWAIPANSDNPEGAVRLMDFMFSELGQMVNNYGPVYYWAKPDTSKGDTVTGVYDSNKYYVSDSLVLNELNPIVSPKVKASLANQSGDFWSYSRGYLGATHGIGNVRPTGLNIQATNYYAQGGLINIQSAYTVGNNGKAGDGAVLKLATISKLKNGYGDTVYTWNTSVPVGYTQTYMDNENKYSSLTGFWAVTKLNNNSGWVAAVTRGHANSLSDIIVISGTSGSGTATTYAKVLEERDNFNKLALYTYAYSVNGDNTYVPTYALYA